MAGWVDSQRPSPPKEIRLPGRRGLDYPRRESIHLGPLIRRTGRVRSEGCRLLRFPGPEIDETGSGASDRKGRELVRDRGDRAASPELTGLLVADHFRQEVDEIGRLHNGAAILADDRSRRLLDESGRL